MTDSMIDRVEQAIKDNIEAALPDGVNVDYRYAARAAIEAMREPTRDKRNAKARQKRAGEREIMEWVKGHIS